MPKVLIVDDQPWVRELLSQTLIDDGYHVETAGDPESAKAHFHSSPPDLVLLDLYLDGPEGFHVLKDIKRQHPQLPVIILTAYDSYMDDARLCEVDAYVVKTFDFGELKQKVAQALASQPARSRAEADS